MKSNVTFLLILLSSLVMPTKTSLAQSSSTASTGTPVSFRVEFHPGETVRYAFSLKVDLTSQVNPSAPSELVLSFTPRQYQMEGEIVATFAPSQAGEPLRGTVQFQGLTVKNWVSSAKVADWEARLHQLEATPTALTTVADGNLQLAGKPASSLLDPFFVDVDNLRSIAQSLFISRLSGQPLAPGQQRESTDFPIPGVLEPWIRVTTLTQYIADVPIAHRPSAEIRLATNVPIQSHSVPTKPNAPEVFMRLHGDDVFTYLFDLDAHQISFLHETEREETVISAQSADSSAAVRIPINLIKVNFEGEETARQMVASASPQREADLAAFEKSLQEPPAAASMQSGTTVPASPGGEVSLGDLARRVRAERAAQGRSQSETTLSGGGAASEGPPAGFKEEGLPNGHMSVFVPAEASKESDSTSSVVHLHALLNKPRAIVMISLGEVAVGQIGSPEDALEATVNGLRAKGFRVGSSERKTINGKPGIVFQLPLETEGKSFLELQANVISGSNGFAATCGTRAEDFPNVESLCRTVVESIRVRQGETTITGSSSAVGGVPSGFQQVTFPGGEMIVSVPAQASEVQRTSENLVLRAYVGTPPTAVAIALTEVKAGEARSPDDQFNEVAQELSAGQQLRALRTEKTTINGKPALVAEVVVTVQGKPFHGLQAFVISGGKGFIVTCEALPADFPKIESTCRTVINSVRAP